MTTTTSTLKLTKRDYFKALRELVENNELECLITRGENEVTISSNDFIEFLDHEVELLDKKNATDRKPTEKQVANAGLKEKILAYLAEVGKGCTVAEIRKGVAEFEDATPQRVTALMYQLIADGKVSKTIEKRVSYFEVVGE